MFLSTCKCRKHLFLNKIIWFKSLLTLIARIICEIYCFHFTFNGKCRFMYQLNKAFTTKEISICTECEMWFKNKKSYFLKSDDLQPPLYTDMSFRVDCLLVEKLYVLCYRIEKNYSWFYFAVHYRCMIQIWRSLCCSIYLGASSSSS